MVVAQLVEWSLLTPVIRGLNPIIGKFYLPIVHLNRKDKNKEKEAHLYKTSPLGNKRKKIDPFEQNFELLPPRQQN